MTSSAKKEEPDEKTSRSNGFSYLRSLCLYATFAQAGPCSEDIAQFEAAIRQSAGNPYAGLTGPQSVGAQLEHQPTQRSVKRAQLRLRANFAAAMARAKLLDYRGDGTGCNSALSAAKRMYIF